MRHAIAPCGAGAGVAENAVLVGIERHRLAMPFNIRAGRIHIGKSALALDHLEVHQLTGRVVDIDEQGALRPAILKPPMLRTVDLDQLAAAVPTIARLIGARAARNTIRSEEHTSELQSLMRISYAVFCLTKNKSTN